MGELLGIQAVAVVIFAFRGDKAAVHPFLLQAQHHHHIRAFQPLAHVVEKLTAEVFHACGHQGWGGDQAQAVFHFPEQDQVAAGHAAVGDVAADGDRQALQAAFGAADRQGVQQGLRGVFVPPVARVQDRAIHLLRQKVDRPGGSVPHDQKVRVHGVQGHGGVDQGFALFHRGIGDGHVHHVGTKPLSGEFKGRLGAGGRLKKQVDLGHARQRVGLFHRAAVQVDIPFRKVKDRGDLQRAKLLDPQKMAGAEGHGRVPFGFPLSRAKRREGASAGVYF